MEKGTQMKRAVALGIGLVALATIGSAQLARQDAGAAVHTGVASQLFDADAPAAWAPQDPADTLYRTAREALNRGEYRRAAELFEQIADEEPESEYAPDALYWAAFARYRLGGDRELERALEALHEQHERYPQAGTRRDAEQLMVRIHSSLARRGHAESAESIAALARSSAETGLLAAEAVMAQLPMIVEGAMAAAGPAMTAAMAQAGPAMAEAMAHAGVEMERAMLEAGARHGWNQEGCSDEDELRLTALSALMEMDDDRALPILRQVLQKRDGCPLLRQRALMVVAESDSEDAEEILLDVVRNDPHPDVRAQAVFWLSEVDTDQAVDVLGELLRTSDDRKIQERALFALSEHDSQEAGRILRDYASREDVPTELRMNAIFWLGERGEPQDLEMLRGMFARTSSREVKERILFAIAESDQDEAAEWLMGIALSQNESTDIRKKALFWASEAGAPIRQLVQLYDRATDRAMKEQLIFVYAERDETESIDKLVDIARNERDMDLRKKAIFWLSESDDPRVTEILLEIIGR